jgi:hypothetical protein
MWPLVCKTKAAELFLVAGMALGCFDALQFLSLLPSPTPTPTPAGSGRPRSVRFLAPLLSTGMKDQGVGRPFFIFSIL